MRLGTIGARSEARHDDVSTLGAPNVPQDESSRYARDRREALSQTISTGTSLSFLPVLSLTANEHRKHCEDSENSNDQKEQRRPLARNRPNDNAPRQVQSTRTLSPPNLPQPPKYPEETTKNSIDYIPRRRMGSLLDWTLRLGMRFLDRVRVGRRRRLISRRMLDFSISMRMRKLCYETWRRALRRRWYRRRLCLWCLRSDSSLTMRRKRCCEKWRR